MRYTGWIFRGMCSAALQSMRPGCGEGECLEQMASRYLEVPELVKHPIWVSFAMACRSGREMVCRAAVGHRLDGNQIAHRL